MNIGQKPSKDELNRLQDKIGRLSEDEIHELEARLCFVPDKLFNKLFLGLTRVGGHFARHDPDKPLE